MSGLLQQHSFKKSEDDHDDMFLNEENDINLDEDDFGTSPINLPDPNLLSEINENDESMQEKRVSQDFQGQLPNDVI